MAQDGYRKSTVEKVLTHTRACFEYAMDEDLIEKNPLRKLVMIDIVNKTYRALRLLFDDQLGHELVQYLAKQDPLTRWNDPIST